MLFAIMIILSISGVSASGKNVIVTKDYVKATALDSCGHSSYAYHTATFVNYCPWCHKHGVLIWNPKGTKEGEWTCKHCDSDFCAADGKTKLNGRSIYLIVYKGAKNITVTPVKPPEPKKSIKLPNIGINIITAHTVSGTIFGNITISKPLF